MPIELKRSARSNRKNTNAKDCTVCSHHGGHDLVEELHDRDLGTQALPYRAHFETDVATADDDHLLGDLCQLQRTRRGDNPAGRGLCLGIGQS